MLVAAVAESRRLESAACTSASTLTSTRRSGTPARCGWPHVRAARPVGRSRARDHALGLRDRSTLAEAHGAETVSGVRLDRRASRAPPALDQLHERGIRVLLPVAARRLRPRLGATTSPGSCGRGRLGLLEPAGPSARPRRDRRGGRRLLPRPRRHRRRAPPRPRRRLLRPGAGRARTHVLRALLVVYDDEVLDDVPTEPHDQRVDAHRHPRPACHADLRATDRSRSRRRPGRQRERVLAGRVDGVAA